MEHFSQQQLQPSFQPGLGQCTPRETPSQISVAKLEPISGDSTGDALWSPTSWESQASFEVLADILCLSDRQESFTSDQSASCNTLQPRTAAISSGCSGRSSLDSDRSSLSETVQAPSLNQEANVLRQPLQQSCQSFPQASSQPQLSLRLNHDDVISAWHKMSGGRGILNAPPATSLCIAQPGQPPHDAGTAQFVPIGPQDCHQPCTQPTMIPTELPKGSLSCCSQPLDQHAVGPNTSCCQVSGDGAEPMLPTRQARLDRYREKKRTRGFSSKIRYEMRKINAERRPRVKGRFVKREGMADDPALDLLDPLADYDSMDFSILTPQDICEESFLI